MDDVLEKEPIFTAEMTWTASTVQDAEDCAETGYFSLAADLAEWISAKDTRVISALQTRLEVPMALPWDDDSEEIGAVWNDICPWEEELAIKRDMLMLGFSLVEITSIHIDGITYPRLWRKNPRFLEYRKSEKAYYLNTVDGYIKIDFDNGEWALFSTKSRERPWVYGIYRALSKWCLLTQYALDDCGNFSKKYGSGIWVGNIADEKKRRTLGPEIRSMGRNGVIMLPHEDKIELVESSASAADVFFKQIEMATQEIAISIVGANLTQQASAGAGQVANVHLQQQVSRWILDNFSFGWCVQNKALKPFGKLVGRTYQTPLRDMSTLEDERVIAAARQSNSQAVSGAVSAGVKISQEEAREMLFLDEDDLDENDLVESGESVGSVDQPMDESTGESNGNSAQSV